MLANDDLFTLADLSLPLRGNGVEAAAAGVAHNGYHGQAVAVILADLFICGEQAGVHLFACFLLKQAKAAGADAYVSADFKYHEFFDAENQLIIADVGHFESEQFAVDLFYHILTENFRNFAPLKSTINTNPVNYL